MILGRLVVGVDVAEDRQQVEIEAHSPSKQGRRRGSAGQEVVKQCVHTSAAARRARLVMGRGSTPHPVVVRAHLEDLVGWSSPYRAAAASERPRGLPSRPTACRHTAEAILAHTLMVVVCAKIMSDVKGASARSLDGPRVFSPFGRTRGMV